MAMAAGTVGAVAMAVLFCVDRRVGLCRLPTPERLGGQHERHRDKGEKARQKADKVRNEWQKAAQSVSRRAAFRMVGPGAGDCYSVGNGGERRGSQVWAPDGPMLDTPENGETNRGAHSPMMAARTSSGRVCACTSRPSTARISSPTASEPSVSAGPTSAIAPMLSRPSLPARTESPVLPTPCPQMFLRVQKDRRAAPAMSQKAVRFVLLRFDSLGGSQPQGLLLGGPD